MHPKFTVARKSRTYHAEIKLAEIETRQLNFELHTCFAQSASFIYRPITMNSALLVANYLLAQTQKGRVYESHSPPAPTRAVEGFLSNIDCALVYGI